MVRRAIVDADLAVVDGDRGEHARALRVQRSCVRALVALGVARTSHAWPLRVHPCGGPADLAACRRVAKFVKRGGKHRNVLGFEVDGL